jgi:hypothetical protein
VRFVDVDGDGAIGPGDRTYLGKTIPDFYYGLNLNGGWKRLDASLFFQGVQGVQIYNQFRRAAEHLGAGGTNQLSTTTGRWTGPGTSDDMPRAVATDPNANARMSDRWVEDGSFFRLRNVQVGYLLPNRLVGLNLQSARVFLSATNLLTSAGTAGSTPRCRPSAPTTASAAA